MESVAAPHSCWWKLAVVPVVIAILVSAGFHAKRVAEQQTALRVVQTVITVQAPVEDGNAGPVNTHSVHCDITVKNVNLDTDMIVPAHNFLMWESLKDGPLRPVEDALAGC